MSGVMCHVSGVRCHVHYLSFFFFLIFSFLFDKVMELVGGGSVFKKAYPVHLVEGLIQSAIVFLQIFKTIRARDLEFLHNVHHLLSVMCHVSRVTGYLYCVTYHMLYIYFFYFSFFSAV